MITPELKEAIALLKAWTKSHWKDFIQTEESPLMHKTKMFIESVEQANKESR